MPLEVEQDTGQSLGIENEREKGGVSRARFGAKRYRKGFQAYKPIVGDQKLEKKPSRDMIDNIGHSEARAPRQG